MLRTKNLHLEGTMQFGYNTVLRVEDGPLSKRGVVASWRGRRRGRRRRRRLARRERARGAGGAFFCEGFAGRLGPPRGKRLEFGHRACERDRTEAKTVFDDLLRIGAGVGAGGGSNSQRRRPFSMIFCGVGQLASSSRRIVKRRGSRAGSDGRAVVSFHRSIRKRFTCFSELREPKEPSPDPALRARAFCGLRASR